MAAKQLTREEHIAAATARHVIAVIAHRTRTAALQKWSKAELVRYYINCTTLKEDGPFTVQCIRSFKRSTLVAHIADYDINLEDFEEVLEQYGIAWEDLLPIINLYETAAQKGKQP